MLWNGKHSNIDEFMIELNVENVFVKNKNNLMLVKHHGCWETVVTPLDGIVTCTKNYKNRN
jgi:hypothetical protein